MNFPVLGAPQRWPISEVGDYCRLIGRLSVISIRHARKLSDSHGFLVYVSGFSLLRAPRARALHQPTKARRAPPHVHISCLSLLLLDPPPFPRAAAHAPAAEYHAVHQHRGALRGTPRSVCPQAEPNATELPSCACISARAARRLGGWGKPRKLTEWESFNKTAVFFTGLVPHVVVLHPIASISAK